MLVYRSCGERLVTWLQCIRLNVLSRCDDPGAPGSYTGPYMLDSGSYHVRNKQTNKLLTCRTMGLSPR